MVDPSQQFTDYLDPYFQRLILALLTQDADFLARSRSIIDPSYFSTTVYKYICKALFNFWDDQDALPSVNLLAIGVSKYAADAETRARYTEAVREIQATPLEDINRSYIEKELIQFAQRAVFASTIYDAWTNIKTVDIGQTQEKISKVLRFPSIYGQLGLNLQEDWNVLLTEQVEDKFPLGLFPRLTQAMRGGAQPGELFMILAKQKAGKSMILVNLALGLLLSGHNVVIYTLEMYEKDILARTIASLAGVPTNRLVEYSDAFVGQIMDLKIMTPGRLIIREFPGLETTLSDLNGHMETLKANLKGIVVPVIDYLDLVVPTHRSLSNETREQREVLTLTRNFGKRHGVPIYSATQGNRESLSADEMDERHQQFYNRGMIAEYMFAFNQSKYDYAANRFFLSSMLSRHDRKDERIYFKQDWSCARMYEITENEYLQLEPDPKLLKNLQAKEKGNFQEKGIL